jgi:hypothetical protein
MGRAFRLTRSGPAGRGRYRASCQGDPIVGPVARRRHPTAAPATAARPHGGVPRRVPDRNCVAALVFMARTSTPWALLPAKELGCGSATTCWRRLDAWLTVRDRGVVWRMARRWQPRCRDAFRNVLGTVMVETAVRGHHARTGMSHAIVGVARCRLP